MRSHGLSIQHSVAYKQRCRARLHEEDISLSFVPLDLTVSFSANPQETVARKVCKLLHCEMVRVLRSIVVHFLIEPLERRGRPLFESWRRGFLCGSNQHNRQNLFIGYSPYDSGRGRNCLNQRLRNAITYRVLETNKLSPPLIARVVAPRNGTVRIRSCGSY